MSTRLPSASVLLKDAYKCQAKNPATCRYHGVLLRMKDALNKGDYAGYEAAMQELAGVSEGGTSKGFVPVLPAEPVTGDVVSAEVSVAYGHFSVIYDHLHNSSETGSPQEIIYYSSPQGQLELQRRLRNKYNDDYVKIQAVIEQMEKAGEPKPKFMLDEEYISEAVAQGKQDLAELTADPISIWNDRINETNATRHYLVEQSHRWLSTLSTEQQEAVSWLTSNGFHVAQYAFGGGRGPEARYLFEDVLDEKAIPKNKLGEAKQAYSEAYVKKVRSAFKNVPKFEEPVTIVRGTSLFEVRDVLPGGGGDSFTAMMDAVERGDFTGKKVNPHSRMKKLPLSTSVSARRAASFSKRLWASETPDVGEEREVAIVIKAKSATSPVNVSAWGSAELEVLTNPLSDYTIVGGRRVNDDLFVLELEEN